MAALYNFFEEMDESCDIVCRSNAIFCCGFFVLAENISTKTQREIE